MDVLSTSIMNVFKEKNIRPSFIRVKIMEYLTNNRNHPTVDEIYRHLIEEIPTLSKVSVYNSLKVFVKAGLVRVITIEDNEARYDIDVSDHGHFKCISCGKIYDFPADALCIRPGALEGFKVTQRDVYFKGICPKCLNNK